MLVRTKSGRPQAGRPLFCRYADKDSNEWHEGKALRRDGKQGELLTGQRFIIKTAAGKELPLTPE